MFKNIRNISQFVIFQLAVISCLVTAQDSETTQSIQASAAVSLPETCCTSNQACCVSARSCRDILFELKTAAFFPTHRHVRDIYGKALPLFGAEVTFQICTDNYWYGFACLDVIHKRGHSVGLCERTSMRLTPITFGFKYFVPFGGICSGCSGDYYVGLGIQAAHLRTKNCGQVVRKTSNWGGGAIAKLGTYINLPHCLFLDFFIDYQITRFDCDRCLPSGLIPIKAKLDGVSLGVGFGYRFA